MLGLSNIAQRFFGSSNERKIRPMMARTAEINALEPHYVKKTDEQLKDMTAQFKARLAKGETLEDLLPEAFAVVREAAKRTLGQRHFDVQLVGGMVLHEGNIAEMKTGEGKTLVATLAVYLIALAQYSMAPAAALVAEASGLPVLTTPDSAVQPLKQLLGVGG